MLVLVIGAGAIGLGPATVTASAHKYDSTPISTTPVANIAGGARAASQHASGVSGSTTRAAASVVAAEDADHIVLGLRAYGTQDLADQIGGRTLLDDPEWQDSLRSGIADSGTRFSVNLDGLSGDSPYSKVMNGVQGGLRGEGATNWELLQLYQSGRLGGADLYSGGGAVENPFG